MLLLGPNCAPFLRCASLLFLLGLAASGARAEDPAALKTQVQETAGLEESQRSGLLASLDAAQQNLGAATRKRAETEALRAAAAGAATEVRRLERELARDESADIERSRRRIDALDDTESLEQELRALQARIEPLRRELQAVTAALDANDTGTGVSQVRLQESIDALSQRLAETTGDGGLADRVGREQIEAERELRLAEFEHAQVRAETIDTRRAPLLLQQRLLRRQLEMLEPLEALLQSKLGERGEAELGALEAALAVQQLALAEAPRPLADAAAANVELGRTYAQANRRLSAMRVDTATLARERERLQRALRDAESRVALGASGEAVGAVLLRERQRLPQPEVLRRQIAELREEVVQLRLRLLDVADAEPRLESLANELNAAAADEEPPQAAGLQGAAAPTQDVQALVRTRGDLLRRLDTTLRRLIERIEQAEVTLEGQLEASLQLKALLDRQLFWIPSHRSVDLDWLRQQGAGWSDLLNPPRLGSSVERVLHTVSERFWSSLLGLLLVIGLFVLQRRARARLPELAPPLRRIREDRYALTWQALGWTILAALPWAAMTWLGGRLLQISGEPGRYTHSIGIALATLTGSIALFTFLRWSLIERGLVHAHFRWTRARREALATAVPRAAWVLLPAQLLSVLALVRGQDLAIDTAGRSLLMLFAITGGGLFWWLLAPGRLWSPRGGVVEPVRLRQALRIALVALLLLILALTLKGYVFTAGVLVRCLWETGGVMLAVSLLHGLLSRWFLLGERRLALQRAEARREAERADGADSSDSELPVESEAEQMDIQSISAQTQRLVRAVSASALVVLLFWVWADILPALQRLDEIALWSFSDKAADGSAIIGQVSLRAALIGAAALLLTVVAARNLPGLLEIGLLNRVHIDAPTRYAITTLARYAIVIVGVLLGLSFLGMRWSQLQWMAAALTVGLGFGLQEIFANFVSGLILLFERPFRVGDIITIGEFTGRVTRIRTRATTILDFDNKEVVIPNKAFITDRLTNWTLSDSMTRLIVKVGVAYGSDVAQVHRLLLKAAAECPHITSEPPPRTWLMAFGPSSLDFELRVFVPSIDLRLLAQSDLHGRVATLLAEQDIEIAFPQMDLHVRDLPAALAEGRRSSHDERPEAPAV